MIWNKSYNYYNTKKREINGKRYDSNFEAGYAQDLEMKLLAKEIKGFDTHVKIPLVVNKCVVADYSIDFVVCHKDKTVEYVETKGWATDVWKLKWKIFCANYEDKKNVKISLVMQGKNYNPRMRKI